VYVFVCIVRWCVCAGEFAGVVSVCVCPCVFARRAESG